VFMALGPTLWCPAEHGGGNELTAVVRRGSVSNSALYS
jgi:hypothetical protein